MEPRSGDWIASFPLRGYKDFGDYHVEIDGVMRTFEENSPIFLTPGSRLQESIAEGKGFEFPSESISVRYNFSDGNSDSTKNDGRPVVAYRVTSCVTGILDGGNVLSNFMFLRPHIVEWLEV